jgi:hypothetical protein
MEWEKKTEMIKLSNNISDSISRTEFVKYVVDNLNDFDNQSWDMFFTSVELDDSIYENYKLHKMIYKKSKGQQTDSYMTAMRMALYEEILKNRKKYEKK